MTGKMKTVCVGRFLVDVPTNAEISLLHQMMDGFEIGTVEESETAFHTRLAAPAGWSKRPISASAA